MTSTTPATPTTPSARICLPYEEETPKSTGLTSSPRVLTPANGARQGNVSVSDEPSPGPAKRRKLSYDIKGALESDMRGAPVLKQLEMTNTLSRDNRIRLIQIAVSMMIDRVGTYPTSSEKMNLAQSIVNDFPCLKLKSSTSITGVEHLYESARKNVRATGYIQDRIENIQKRLKRMERRSLGKEARRCAKGSGTSQQRHGWGITIADPVSDSESTEAMTKWLQHNSDPRERVQEYMQSTCKSRLAWIHGEDQPTFCQIVKKFPRYTDADGHVWIEEDFRGLYNEEIANRFTHKWEDTAAGLLEKLKGAVKEPSGKQLLDDVMEAHPSTEDISKVVLFLLPNLLAPKLVAPQKGKKFKPTIPEARESFINIKKVGTSVEEFRKERRDTCQKWGISWQPQVLVVGDSVLNFEQVFVLVEDVVYQVQTLLKAVDLCFKAIFLFNLEYSLPVMDVWSYIQFALYDIHTKYDRPSSLVKELVGLN